MAQKKRSPRARTQGTSDLPALDDLDAELESALAEALAATGASRYDDDGTLDIEVDDTGDQDVQLASVVARALDGDPDELSFDDEVDRLLARSFGPGAGLDEDPALAFPEIHEEDGDDEILAGLDAVQEELFLAGDDGLQVATAPADGHAREVASLQAQIAEMARLLSIRELELRTAEERLQTLEQQVVNAARQVAAAQREHEAIRRRADREREDTQRYAGEKILKEFLGVYDNLERALAHSGDAATGPLGQGVAMTLGQFMAALRRAGAERVDAAPGRPFDPNFHEAVGQEHSDAHPPGTILHEMQAGFALNGRLLRAAMVAVSRGPAEQTADAPGSDEAPAVSEAAPAGGDAVQDEAAAGGGDDGADPGVEGSEQVPPEGADDDQPAG